MKIKDRSEHDNKFYSVATVMGIARQKVTDAKGFDEDGPHWRLGSLLQSLCRFSTLAKLGKSYQVIYGRSQR